MPITPSELARLRAFADTLADAARAAILPHFRAEPAIYDKLAGGFDPVTEADHAAESVMRALIEAEFPDHGVLGEEYGETPSRNGLRWVIDPIDGTRAFISGLPLWGVLIALCEDTRPILGVMDQPYLDERFVGHSSGAELNARGAFHVLATRPCPSLAGATIATTDPHLFAPAEHEAFTRVRHAARLTRYGTDCYAYAMVAAGCIDLVIESGLRPWDVAALIPILEGAGGGLVNWRGEPAWEGGQVLAYGDLRARDAALALLEGAAYETKRAS